MRYAIKHKSGKFLYEDQIVGFILVDELDDFITFGRKENAEKYLDTIIRYATEDNGVLITEDGEFHSSELEIVEL